MVYLRRMDRQRAMDDVRDLSWGGPFVFLTEQERLELERREQDKPAFGFAKPKGA